MLLRTFFRLVFLGLAGFFFVWGFNSVYTPWLYKTRGVTVTGRVEGFWAGKYGGSVQPEPTAIRNGRRIARKPAFRYPTGLAATDSLTGKNSPPQLFQHYRLGEKVTVVYLPGNPADAWLFEWRGLGGVILLLVAGVVMVWMAFQIKKPEKNK